MGHPGQSCCRSFGYLALLACATGVAMLWCASAHAHTASIYKCVDPHGQTAYRDTPCATHARQTKLDLAGQPLIDPGSPRHAATARSSRPVHSRTRRVIRITRKHKQPTSWECRAADGEVFYRHARCPGSVPGDGVVRSAYAETLSHSHTRRRRGAWSPVPVHGVKISRAEACRRVHAAGAATRDGHQRDATVSTYAHLTGRDPCSGT